MAWRRIPALLVVLAHVLALSVMFVPVRAMQGAAAMPCYDGGPTSTDAASDQWPCCVPVCCLDATIAARESARPLAGMTPFTLSKPRFASVTVGPGDRPPKA